MRLRLLGVVLEVFKDLFSFFEVFSKGFGV